MTFVFIAKDGEASSEIPVAVSCERKVIFRRTSLEHAFIGESVIISF